MGRPWQMTGRLGRTGAEGLPRSRSASMGKDRQTAPAGTLSGQDRRRWRVGRARVRPGAGSVAAAAGAEPGLEADGQVQASSGLVVADDLELLIGGSPAHGAVAVPPAAAAAARRGALHQPLNLGAWLPPLLQGRRPALPTGIELSADTADLAGGVLRRLRTGVEVGPADVTLREADAELPGGATFPPGRAAGEGRFTGDARLGAPNVPQTLAWLHGSLPTLVDALPAGAWQTASLAATVMADAESIGLGNISGDANGAPLAGDVALRRGSRPALTANLRVAGPALDSWLPHAAHRAGGCSRRHRGAPIAVRRLGRRHHDGRDGTGLAGRDVPTPADAGGRMPRRHARASSGIADSGTTWPWRLAGRCRPPGRSRTVGWTCRWAIRNAWPTACQRQSAQPARCFAARATLMAVVNGTSAAMAVTAAAELSDARVKVDGTLDLPGRHWRGAVSLHHPGAPRLLYALGLGEALGWLGDGSFSLQATTEATPDQLALSGVDISRGGAAGGWRPRADGAGVRPSGGDRHHRCGHAAAAGGFPPLQRALVPCAAARRRCVAETARGARAVGFIPVRRCRRRHGDPGARRGSRWTG